MSLIKNFALFLYKILFYFDFVLRAFANRSILIWFKDFLHNDSYQTLAILNYNIIFFVPNSVVQWRVNTFFSKEPETLEWIDNFKFFKDGVFWDIGANIGLYSIYASLKHKHLKVISFEPSTSNLRVLSRNISINNLDNRITINQFPLTDKENQYLTMHESEFAEGAAMNSFGENFGFDGININSKNNYKIFGTNINYLLDNKILEIPDYIKIDVDGLEHFILKGGNKYLNNKNIKSILIELNENFNEQLNEVLYMLNSNGFNLKHKISADNSALKNTFSGVYNYIFER